MPTDSAAIFASTAAHYAQYRPGYPPDLFAHLVSALGLDGNQRVLDLGCGPGTVAIRLAPHVREVVACDPQPAMLEAGRTSTAEITNIDWRVADSTTVRAVAGDRPYELVTMGAAFHWMDRDALLGDLDAMVTDGGAIALIGDGPPEWHREAPWNADLVELRRTFLGPDRRAGGGTYSEPVGTHQDVLRRSAFADVTTTSWKWVLQRSVDDLVGLQFSYSFSSPALLGDRADDYAAAVRGLLLPHATDGVITTHHDTELIMARRP